MKSQFAQEAVRESLRLNRAEIRWRRLLSSLSQWQGAWRDPELFDTEKVRAPMRLSSHRFNNGVRCILRVRDRFSRSYLDTASYSRTKALDGGVLAMGTSVDPAVNEDEAANMIYARMEKKLQDKLVAPMRAEVYGGLHAESGVVMILYKSHVREAYLVFVRKLHDLPVEDARLMFVNPAGVRRIVKKWRLGDIKKVLRKQVVERKTGLELEFYSGRHLLLNLGSEDQRDTLGSKLVRLREKWCRGLQYSGTVDPMRDFEKRKLSTIWAARKISTMDYLMALNTYSGRSFDNLAQYPVFPWILADDRARRDLSRNMGMAGDPERAEEFKKRYVREDSAGLGRFHFGSHYSNPGIVLQYTMRLYPFFEGYLKFFSGLDDPNRMFHSIQETYQSATKDISDVREITPEFYSLPEIFLNRESLLLGQRGHGKSHEETDKVDSVLLPRWADGNAYRYVSMLRQALESDEAIMEENGLAKWIDLVFGCQQRGRAAEKACNLFPPVSYDPAKVLFTARSDPQLHEAYRMQAYHWGQTPQQLFQRKHPAAQMRARCVWDDTGRLQSIHTEKLTGLKRIVKISLCQTESESAAVAFVAVDIDGKFLHGTARLAPRPVISVVPPEESMASHSIWRREDLTANALESPIAVLQSRKVRYLARGGCWDGSIQLNPMESSRKATFTLFYHSSTVTCLTVDQYERLALVGTKGGECAVYSVEDDMFWRPRDVLEDHSGAITCVCISEEMQLFATAGVDGAANIYRLDCKPSLIRTFRQKDSNPLHWVLAQNLTKIGWTGSEPASLCYHVQQVRRRELPLLQH